MELGIFDVNFIRHLFESVVASNPPTKSMKTLLARCLDIDELLGGVQPDDSEECA